MTDIDPTQAEADALLAMKKVRVTDTQYDFPSMGGSIHIPLKSEFDFMKYIHVTQPPTIIRELFT